MCGHTTAGDTTNVGEPKPGPHGKPNEGPAPDTQAASKPEDAPSSGLVAMLTGPVGWICLGLPALIVVAQML